MKIRAVSVIESLLYLLLLWLPTVGLQLTVVGCIVYGAVGWNGGVGAMGVLICIPTVFLTYCIGGLNTIPGIFWRFRKNVETRIVAVEHKRAMQMRLLGHWFWVDAEYCDWIRVAFVHEWSSGKFFGTVDRMKAYKQSLAHYLKDGFAASTHLESVERIDFVQGEQQ